MTERTPGIGTAGDGEIGEPYASAEVARAILEGSPDCIKVLGLDARLEFMSRGGLCAMEVDDFDRQLKGADWLSFWQEEDRPKVRAAIADALAGGVGRFEGFCPTAKGSPRWWEVTVSAARGRGGRPDRLVSISRDVTERRRAEAELARAQGAVTRAARLSAMGAMATALAHELNQPLTAVVNYTAAARRMVAGGAAAAGAVEALAAAEKAALAAGETVRRLRAFAAKGEVTRRPVDPAEIVDGALRALREELHRGGVGVSVRVEPGVGRVHGDRVKLEHVLLNLLKNAAAAVAGRPVREIEVGVRPAGAAVEFRVADSGPGLPEERRADPFAPLGAGAAEDLDLGLTFCRAVVEAHGGNLRAEPGPGNGAAFAVPCARLLRETADG